MLPGAPSRLHHAHMHARTHARPAHPWAAAVLSPLLHYPTHAAPAAPAEVDKKFKASAWGQKVAKRAATASMTDLDRYKAMVTKSKKARQVRTVLNQMKKVARGGVAKKGAAPAKKAAGKK